MTRHVTRDLAAPGRVAHVNGVLQVEVRGDRREVISVVIHIVTIGRLRRTPVTPAVVRDNAKAMV